MNYNVEAALLAGYAANPGILLSTEIEPDVFSDVSRPIFLAMRQAVEDGLVPDLLYLSSLFPEKNGQISSIFSTEVPRANIPHFEDLARKAAIMRQIQKEMARISAMADPQEAMSAMSAVVADVYARSDAKEIKNISDVMRETVSMMIEERKGTSGVKKLYTGFPSLDKLVGGIFPGKLLVVAARPSVGKSTLAFMVAKHVAATGTMALIESVEMPREDVAKRWISDDSLIKGVHIRNPTTMSDSDLDKVVHSAEKIGKLPIMIVDSPIVKAPNIEDHIRKLIKHGLGIVIVDYLQLVTDGDPDYSGVTRVTRECKRMARQYGIPIIVCSQLSRASAQRADTRPILTDLRGSGEIEQAADIIVFLHRELQENGELGSTTEFIVAKNRDGATGTARLYFDTQTTRFVEFHYQ